MQNAPERMNDTGTSTATRAESVQARSLDVHGPRARGYVYFVRVGDRIKIGYSTRPTRRLLALQTANPGKLEILGTMWATRDREREIHRQFKRLHVRGEWFMARSDLLQYIERYTPEGDATKKARHQAEMPVGPPPARQTKASEAEIRKLRGSLCRLRPTHPEPDLISNLSEQLANYAKNPAALRPMIITSIERLVSSR